MEWQQIIDFWFAELSPQQWWQKDAVLDQQISERFAAIHAKARAGELAAWRATALGSLAEVLILDQFSRNMYRAKPQAFAYDAMALVLSQEAIRRQLDAELVPTQQAFLYLPFMHSESLMIHEQALQLFAKPGLEHNLDFEQQHYDIIKRFGRYPHRNAILGRTSSNEELEFLQQPGSSF